MVHIVDGEILQDNDPRVQRMKKGTVQNSSFGTQSATLRAGRPSSQGPTVTPPRRPTGHAESPFNIPPQLLAPVFNIGDVSITAVHLIIVGIASLVFGWKGGLCAGVLIYFYLQNLEASARNPSGSAPGRMDMGLRDYFQRDSRPTSSTFPSQRPPSQPRGRRLNEE